MSTEAEPPPAKKGVPRDPDDPRFALSFPADQSGSPDAAAFFKSNGYVVFRDAVAPETCAAARSAMWAFIESKAEGFDREHPDTWDNWRPWAYGMPTRAPGFQPEMLRIRQAETLHRIFADLIGEEDLLVSHDRWMLNLPTRAGGEGEDGEGGSAKRRKRAANPLRVHLDLSPSAFAASDPCVAAALDALTYDDPVDFVRENNMVTAAMGTCLQGMVTLDDNLSQDGGTVVVPGFARRFDEYVASVNAAGDQVNAKSHGSVQEYFHMVMAGPKDVPNRVPMRAGSLLVWDQRTAHGAGPNDSARGRFGMPVRFFPKRFAGGERGRRRAEALGRWLEGSGFVGEVTEHGRRVFGLGA